MTQLFPYEGRYGQPAPSYYVPPSAGAAASGGPARAGGAPASRAPLTAMEIVAVVLAAAALLANIGRSFVWLSSILEYASDEGKPLVEPVVTAVLQPAPWLLAIGVIGALRRRPTGAVAAAAVVYVLGVLDVLTVRSPEYLETWRQEQPWLFTALWALPALAVVASVLLALAQRRRHSTPAGAVLALGLGEGIASMCVFASISVSVFSLARISEEPEVKQLPWFSWSGYSWGSGSSSSPLLDIGALSALFVMLVMGALSAIAVVAALLRRSHGLVAAALLAAVGVLVVSNLATMGSVQDANFGGYEASSTGQTTAVVVAGSLLLLGAALTVLTPGARKWLSARRRPPAAWSSVPGAWLPGAGVPAPDAGAAGPVPVPGVPGAGVPGAWLPGAGAPGAGADVPAPGAAGPTVPGVGAHQAGT